MATVADLNLTQDRSDLAGAPRPGAYFATERELYRIERVVDGRALLEDCRDGKLIDLSVRELAYLRPIRPRADD